MDIKEKRILDWCKVSSSDETSVSEEDNDIQVKKISFKPILDIGITGTVKWFNVKLGYGFVCRHDNQEDIYIHQSAIAKSNPDHSRKSVADGEEILFDIVQGDKEIEAANVTAIDGNCVKGSEVALKYPRGRGRGRGRGEESIIMPRNRGPSENEDRRFPDFLKDVPSRGRPIFPRTPLRAPRGRFNGPRFRGGPPRDSPMKFEPFEGEFFERRGGRGRPRSRGRSSRGRERGGQWNNPKPDDNQDDFFSYQSEIVKSNRAHPERAAHVYGVYRNIKKLDNQWKSNISGGEVIINLSNRIISSGIIGKLKCFNFERGYGFVCRDDTKEDIFIHQSAIDKCDKYHQQKLIKLGEEITFDIVDGDKSNEAANIYSIDEAQIMLCSPSISESGNLSIEDRVISSENISCTDNDNESLQSFLRSDIIQSDDEKKNVELEHRFFHKYDNLENTCMPQLSILTSTFNHQQRLDEELDAYMYG